MPCNARQIKVSADRGGSLVYHLAENTVHVRFDHQDSDLRKP